MVLCLRGEGAGSGLGLVFTALHFTRSPMYLCLLGPSGNLCLFWTSGT